MYYFPTYNNERCSRRILSEIYTCMYSQYIFRRYIAFVADTALNNNLT